MTYLIREELMRYCRVDDDTAADTLVALADSAEAYLETAGVDIDLVDESQFNLAVCALTLHWFDNPTGGEPPAGLRQLINQLKLTPTAKEES